MSKERIMQKVNNQISEIEVQYTKSFKWVNGIFYIDGVQLVIPNVAGVGKVVKYHFIDEQNKPVLSIGDNRIQTASYLYGLSEIHHLTLKENVIEIHTNTEEDRSSVDISNTTNKSRKAFLTYLESGIYPIDFKVESGYLNEGVQLFDTFK